MQELTEKDHSIIEYLIKVGYGWGKYAASVKKQGCASQKQVDTLYNMYNWVNSPIATQKRPSVAEYTSLTDEEIMRG